MLRKGLFPLFFLLVCGALAQNRTGKSSFGLYQNITDYNVELLNNKPVVFDSALSFSTRVAYQRVLSPSWVLNTGITHGFIQNQTLNSSFVDKALSLGADVNVWFKLNNGRLFKEDALFGPYIVFGIRGDYVPVLNQEGFSPWLVHNQYGLGASIRLSERNQLQLQAVVDQKIMDDINTHIQYRIGIVQHVGRNGLRKHTIVVEHVSDADQDGLVDSVDHCPDLYGALANDGCPDSIVTGRKLELDKITRQLRTKSETIVNLQDQLDSLRKSIVLTKDSLNKDSVVTVEIPDEKGNVIDSLGVEADLPAGKNYFIITWSDRNYSKTVQWHAKMKDLYKDAYILPQSTGLYRVGIFAGKNKAKALSQLKEIKEECCEDAWLSIE